MYSAGDIDESTGDNVSKAKRFFDNEYWNFSLSAEDLKGWRSIFHKENLNDLARTLLGKKK